jgi:hypothetical protein
VTKNETALAGVGPHEGCELELMLAGEKPLAMFGDALGSGYEVPESNFAPYVADGSIVRREAIYRPPAPGLPGRFVYFARAGQEWRIEALHDINERIFTKQQPASPDIEREIGRLLGYTEAEIEHYIEWVGRRTPDP